MHNRIVVDTNLFISFLLLPDSTPNKAVRRALRGSSLLVSKDTLEEMAEVLARSKFDKYISIVERQEFLRKLIRIGESVTITKRLQVCRDAKDDKFLELAVNGNADMILTGDKDLLSLHPYREISIISPVDYLGMDD